MKHLEIFQPDIFVYCINAASVKDFNKVYLLKGKLQKNGIPLAVIGPEEACKTFERVAINAADIMLMKPLVASVIAEKITKFLERKKAEEEERKQQEEEQRQAELKKQAEEEEANRRKHILGNSSAHAIRKVALTCSPLLRN